eukprot:UN00165
MNKYLRASKQYYDMVLLHYYPQLRNTEGNTENNTQNSNRFNKTQTTSNPPFFIGPVNDERKDDKFLNSQQQQQQIQQQSTLVSNDNSNNNNNKSNIQLQNSLCFINNNNNNNNTNINIDFNTLLFHAMQRSIKCIYFKYLSTIITNH